MNSAVNPVFAEPTSIPRNTFLDGILGFSPARPGFYGTNPAAPLRITANHLPTLRRLTVMDASTSLLALETGGFRLEDFLALYPVHRSHLEAWLATLPPGDDRPVRLLVPASLADALHLHLDDSLADIPIELLPDSPSSFFASFVATLRIAAGQALLWAIPLLLFGWQPLFWGMAALLVGALLLGFLWRVPISPWLRGVLAGLVLAVSAGSILIFVLNQPVATILFPLLGLMLIPAWLGILLTGVKP